MKIKINFNKILIFLVAFINIPPPYFLLNNDVAKIFVFLQMLFAFLSLILIIWFTKKNFFPFFILLISFFWGIFIISTLINQNGDLFEAIKPFFTTFSLCTFFIINKNKIGDFVGGISLYLKILIFINFLTILFFPNGLYIVEGNVNAHYFLGHRNNSIEYIIPCVLFAALKDLIKINKGKYSISTYFILVISFLTVIYTWSANAIIVMMFLIVTLFFPLSKYVQKISNTFNFSIAYIALFFSIIIFRMQERFEWLIVGILHRSLDFTNRLRIWDNALYWINKSIIHGYGYENATLKLLKIYHPNSCHNYILDFLYMGGIVMLFIVIMIIYLTYKKINHSRNKISRVIEMVILSYFIVGFATPIHKDTLCIMFLIFCVGYYNSYFLINKRSDKVE